MFGTGSSHGGRSGLPAWQKAAAIVPLALLTGSLTSAVGNSSGESAADRPQTSIGPDIPVVPTTPFEVPASVQLPDSLPSGVDPHAGEDGTISTLSQQGIPTAALLAYQRAESVLAQADPACRLEWPLVAAIGRVESDHGRANGNVVGSDGVSRPGIFGIPLTGDSGTAEISDSDNGSYDQDAIWDRAVGPMQFIPTTWEVVAVDGDDDGIKNPQDVDDAALATAVYLCAGDGDLSTEAGAREAVYRYNHSSAYVNLVLSIAEEYAMGNYSMVPNGTTSPTVLTDIDNDAQQDSPGPDDNAVISPPDNSNDGGNDGPSDNGPDNGGPSDGGPSDDGPSDDGPSDDGPSDGPGDDGPSDNGGGLEELPSDVNDNVDDTVNVLNTLAEATRWCQRQLADEEGITQGDIAACADAVVGQTVDQATRTLNGLLDSLLDDVVCGVLGCQRQG